MEFETRLDHAVRWENEVRDRLEQIGFITNKYGQGVQLEPKFRDSIRHMNANLTAQFVRYLPDWVIAVKDKSCYLVEAKSDMRCDTPNYSYECASYDIGIKLHSIGVDVIIIFSGWRADFIYNLTIKKYKKDPRKTNGSGTPFGLIKKESVPLFDDFFQSIISK